MSKVNIKEFFKFCMVGSASALLSVITLFILTNLLQFNYLFSYIVGFISINALTYATSRCYTFKKSHCKVTMGLMRYYVVALFGLALNAVAMYGLVRLVSFHYLVAAVILIVLNAPLNYVLHKRFSFKIGE